MAEKYQQQAQGYPLAPAMPRSDVEYAPRNHQIKSKNRTKRIACVAAFFLILTIIILVFALVVARARTPRVRLADVAVSNNVNDDNSRVTRLTARVSVRNRNFGRYEFDGGVATVRSGDDEVGQFVIEGGRARARSTWRTYVMADLRRVGSANSSSSVVDLRVEGRVRGRVRVLWVIRRSRAAEMSCAMSIDLSANAVRGLRCQ